VVNEGDALYHIAQIARPAKGEETIEQINADLLAAPMFDEDEII
jgi:hypothetical protein